MVVNDTSEAVCYVLTSQCQWHWETLSYVWTYQTSNRYPSESNLSGNKPIRFQTYLIPIPIWYRTHLIPNLSAPNLPSTKALVYWTYQILRLADIEAIKYWAYTELIRFYQIRNLSGAEPIKHRTYLIPKLSDNEPSRYWVVSSSMFKSLDDDQPILVCPEAKLGTKQGHPSLGTKQVHTSLRMKQVHPSLSPIPAHDGCQP